MAIPDPTKLLTAAGIHTPLVGFYDVPDASPFKPFARPKRCLFAAYQCWLEGESVRWTQDHFSCRGGGYWVCGVPFASREDFAAQLNQREGFKPTDELMERWLEQNPPYPMQHENIVIGPLKDAHYDHLKTVTFFVNPDQLSLLLLGAEYQNTSVHAHPAFTTFGSGCGQLAAAFNNFEPLIPRAIIGATDIAMRQHLPPDVLALTVNKLMYRQLCDLDENSFLYKDFWKRLQKAREKHKH